MKTQFTFKVRLSLLLLINPVLFLNLYKRQEMETTTRKAQGQYSARAKRTSTENPPTPINIPSQMSGWNADARVPRAGSSSALNETPKALRFGLIPESPSTARIRKPSFMALESAKKQPKLPGFYNAFATSTPAPKPRLKIALNSGKGKAGTSPYGPPLSQFNINPSSAARGPPSPPSSPTRTRMGSDLDMPSDDGPTLGLDEDYGDAVRDVEMDGDNGDELSEEVEEINSPNWREEVCPLSFAVFTQPGFT